MKPRPANHDERATLLNRLLAVWDERPSLRLGQMIEASRFRGECPLFYLEDVDLIAGLERLIDNPDEG